jgi:hypothetical protein
MSNIKAMVAHVEVDDLEAAIPLYQELSDEEKVVRFSCKDVPLVHIGPCLLMGGAIDGRRRCRLSWWTDSTPY